MLRRRTTVAAILAMVLVPLFGTVDYFMYRPHFASLMGVRLVSCLISGATLLLLRRRLSTRSTSWLAIGLTLQCGLAIAGIPVYLTGTETPHYVSMALLMLSVTALLPWTASQVMVLTVAFTATFVIAGLAHGPLPNVVTFATQVSAILITGILGTVISWLSESVRARELAARRELLAASQEKTELINHLETISAQLATANEDLQERQRETDDFLYVLSHDLRAPLINIQGFGKRLQTDMTALEAGPASVISDDASKRLARMKQSLEFVNAGTAKIDLLITRLLDIARVSSRPGRHAWIETHTMVGDVIKACRFQLEAAGVEVWVGELPRVWGDHVQLNQVFANLVDNAVKYMGDRPQKQIAISCSTRGDRYRFAVRDSGPGIEEKDLEKVFRLFARLEPNGTTGEGVGLATVRAIINRHGGRIWVESTPGEGSTFYFTLPQSPTETRSEAAPISLTQATATPSREEHAAHVH